MWKWETVALLFVGLLTVGVMMGQNFTPNRWVFAIWAAAALMVLVRLLHRQSAELPGEDTSLSSRALPPPPSSTLAMLNEAHGQGFDLVRREDGPPRIPPQ